MNSVERCLCAVRREVPDRAPVAPLVISPVVEPAGVAFNQRNQRSN